MNTTELTHGDEGIERVDKFCYIGSIIIVDGGVTEDVNKCINKAKRAFATLRPIWRSEESRAKTYFQIFESNVKSVLIYGCETWKETKHLTHKLQVFINRSLKNIGNRKTRGDAECPR